MGREEKRGEPGVRLRDRSPPHQLAVWCGLLGVAWGAALWIGGALGLPTSASEVVRTLAGVVVNIGVPAVGTWLATRPTERRAQAGLAVLATWGLLAVPHLVGLPARTAGLNLTGVVTVAIPVVGLALAGWALARGEAVTWRHTASWGRRVAGVGVAVYGLAAALPLTAGIAQVGGFGSRHLLFRLPWLAADKVLTLMVAAVLGLAVARLATPLALPPAAVVATHAVDHVAGNLHRLVEPASAPLSSEAVATAYPIFAVHVIAAMAAVAATAWLATRGRRPSAP